MGAECIECEECLGVTAVRILANRGHMTAIDLLLSIRMFMPEITLEMLYGELIALEAADEVHIAEPHSRKWGIR